MLLTPTEIAAEPKQLTAPIEWNARGGWLEFRVALKVGRLGVAGLTIGGKAPRDIPDRGVAFFMCWRQSKGRPESFARVCWKPLGPHKPKSWKPSWGVPRVVHGSHVHCPDGNWLAYEARLRAGNLPFAYVLDPDPESFEDLKILVQDLFKVEGFADACPYPWPEDLFHRA